MSSFDVLILVMSSTKIMLQMKAIAHAYRPAGGMASQDLAKAHCAAVSELSRPVAELVPTVAHCHGDRSREKVISAQNVGKSLLLAL